MLYHKFLLFFTIIISLSDLQGSSGYRILGIFPLHTKSHMMMFEQLMKGLLKRGHQADVINTLPQKKPYPNYTDIEIPNLINNMDHSFLHHLRDNLFELCIPMSGNDPCKVVLSHKKIQEIIETSPTDPPYDLVIVEKDKKWLDESKNGFIYFTLGSLVNIESFPQKTIESIYKSFRKIDPVRVLMKVPQPNLLPPGFPKNVRTFRWISQLKVLKHKNIRAFITHGGLMSTQEAVACAVPMIGIPLFYDQFRNIDQYVERNIAIRLNYEHLTEFNLDMVLKNILHNRLHSEAAKNIFKKFLDRPLSPMDEACYWVEYFIKYGGKALRSPAMDFSWWQLELLDIYFTLMIFGILVIFILFYLIKFFIKFINGSSVNIEEFKKFN